jgi:hypothetical protein
MKGRLVAIAGCMLALSGCAMTPEQQAAFIRAMNHTTQQNVQRMQQSPIQPQSTTQTRCQDNGIGGVNCISPSY